MPNPAIMNAQMTNNFGAQNMAVQQRNNQTLFNQNTNSMQTTNVINNTFTINMGTPGAGGDLVNQSSAQSGNQKNNAGKGKGGKVDGGKGEKGDKKGKGKNKGVTSGAYVDTNWRSSSVPEQGDTA